MGEQEEHKTVNRILGKMTTCSSNHRRHKGPGFDKVEPSQIYTSGFQMAVLRFLYSLFLVTDEILGDAFLLKPVDR